MCTCFVYHNVFYVFCKVADVSERAVPHVRTFPNRRITAKMPLSATDSTVFYPHTEEQEQHDAVGGAVASPGKCLLAELHPTPAVCGNPRNVTYAAIREMEGFDR